MSLDRFNFHVTLLNEREVDQRAMTTLSYAANGYAANTASDANVDMRQVLLLDATHQILRRPREGPLLPALGSEFEHTRTGSW